MSGNEPSQTTSVWWDNNAQTAAPMGNVAAMRARDHDFPDDHAHYSCCCGSSFTASADAGTTCPRCGDGQPW
jgi:hypothetical protein